MENSPIHRETVASLGRIVRLVGFCAVLAVGVYWVVSALPSLEPVSPPSSLFSPSYPASEPFFAGVDPATVDEIRIAFPNGPHHRLRRSERGWEILDGGRWFAVNADRGSNLFVFSGESPGGITGQLQGSNPANHGRAFGVAPQSGTLVTFLSKGKQVEEFYVGGVVHTQSGWGTYVRRPDSNAVYQLPGKLTDNFSGESIQTWRRRFLFPGVSPTDVEELHVFHSSAPDGYSLMRSSDSATGWWLQHGGERLVANPHIASALCEWIVRLRTADFFEEAAMETGEAQLGRIDLRLSGYKAPVRLLAYRGHDNPAIIRLEVQSPREGESSVLGVFDLLPLWRDPGELVWRDSAPGVSFALDHSGGNEPFALGAGEKVSSP